MPELRARFGRAFGVMRWCKELASAALEQAAGPCGWSLARKKMRKLLEMYSLTFVIIFNGFNGQLGNLCVAKTASERE